MYSRDGGLIVFTNDAGLLQGTVELLVLKALSLGPMHGYGIATWIERVTEDVLRVEEGSLYPALYRMARKRWIKGEWGTSENNRRAKYYRLSAAGRRQFAEQTTGWQRLSAAVNQAVAARGRT
jgi:transcriptional regulator